MIGDKSYIIVFGCDGASVNLANRGLKGYPHESPPWVQFVWCIAHRLELALKDTTLFPLIDENDANVLSV